MESSAELRRLVACPICLEVMQDPCIISTCQHCFCYACINRGIEYGCAPCRLPWVVEHASSEDGGADTKKKKRRKAKTVKFECPVCGMAAFKWMLQRVAPLNAFLNRVRHVMCTVPLTSPLTPQLQQQDEEGREEPTTSLQSSCNVPRAPSPPGAPASISEAVTSVELMVPEGISSSVPPSYPSGSSVALFDESLPLWAHCEAEGGPFTSDSPSVAQVPSALGQPVSPSMQHIRPASSSAAMRDSVSSYRTTESSLVGFLRTPPPATPANGPIEEKIASSPPPDYPASAIPPVVVVVATLPEREERDSYAYHDSHQGTSVPPSFVAANLDGNDIGSYDRLLSPVHVSGRSILDMVAGTSSAKRPPRDSPIRFVPQPVSLLMDASIWGIADDVARGRYMDVIHLAVARLGGAVVNAGVPATLVELCGVGSRDALVSCAASHVVCLVDPGSSPRSIIVDPSAGQCESRIGPTASQSCPRVVGLDWVVSSVERGAWQLGDHEPPVPRDTFVSSTNSFCMMNIVVDLGHSAATSNEGHADALLMRKVQSAIRLAVVGGAAGVWVAWAAPTGQVVAHKVRWEAAAATDDETRRDLFADAASTDSSARGTLILSVGSSVRDAVISSRALLQSFPSHSPTGDDGCGVISNTTSLHLLPVARRSLEWWYRTMQVDGMEEWTRVKASLFDGSMMEWEHQRPRAHTLLYEP